MFVRALNRDEGRNRETQSEYPRFIRDSSQSLSIFLILLVEK